ncbi:excalibur calcium-binding protein [Streptomyces sp. NPDC052020]|uniref:excalibur calcium-binding protein n=1 Tax=Streptomyces sp. NPDC052020 TaxID=3155677 RepID=UPI00344870D8
MRPSTTLAGLLIAVTAAGLPAGTAYAQDLDCGHFTYQEEAQAVFDSDRSDPHRLDEDQGPYDGIACEVLPHRGTGATVSATSRPPRPTAPTMAPTTKAPSPTAPSVTPTPAPTTAPPRPAVSATPPATRGVQGGLGGASTAGPTGWDVGIGLTFVTGAALATGWILRRQRRT